MCYSTQDQPTPCRVNNCGTLTGINPDMPNKPGDVCSRCWRAAMLAAAGDDAMSRAVTSKVLDRMQEALSHEPLAVLGQGDYITEVKP